MVSGLGVPTQLLPAVQFRVAARATPLPTTNTTAIVVSSTIALLFNFIMHTPFPFLWGVSLFVRRSFFCVLSTLEEVWGGKGGSTSTGWDIFGCPPGTS